MTFTTADLVQAARAFQESYESDVEHGVSDDEAARGVLAALHKLVFRWCYAATVELAKGCLAAANAIRENDRDWPAGQEWNGLAGSSKAIFMRQARDLAGIDHEAFLAIVRSGEIDGLDEMFGQ